MWLPLAIWLVTGHVTVVDGDTLRVAGERVRIVDIDAPSIVRPQCTVERAKGEAARMVLADMIAAAGQVMLDQEGLPPDSDGAMRARLIVDGTDVGALLIAEGLAMPWPPGAPKPSWCRRASD